MTDVPIASHSFCVVSGCTGPATTSRLIDVKGGDRHRIVVCRKHGTGELMLEDLDRERIDWLGEGTGA